MANSLELLESVRDAFNEAVDNIKEDKFWRDFSPFGKACGSVVVPPSTKPTGDRSLQANEVVATRIEKILPDAQRVVKALERIDQKNWPPGVQDYRKVKKPAPCECGENRWKTLEKDARYQCRRCGEIRYITRKPSA